ncbi:glutaredoxin-C9-like [Euphorbia lathyris]|uniref:glutaredoxin-C9-like n=1 Tax=Euphorbia lathyris TaxID=212925 RepID=UPI0033144DBD
MQQAIPYKSWVPLYTTTKNPLLSPSSSSISLTHTSNLKELLKGSTKTKSMANLVQENPIIVFARRGCCMSHVVKRLLLGVGVNPPIFEIDEGNEIGVLGDLGVVVEQLPAVFIGGRLFGGLDRVMATHISGDLVPILKEAGALWL